MDELAARNMDPARFVREYVHRARPCVIRGLAASWPPCRDFSIEMLRRRSRSSDVITGVLTEPLIETDDASRRRLRTSAQPYAELLDRLEAPDDDYVQGYALPCQGALSLFEDDLEFLAPLLPTRARPRTGRTMRVFLYKNGFTDWHYHHADETLTIQVAGTKELAFVGPDARSFEILRRIDGYKWLATEPALGSLTMLKTTLDPGDVVYIPVYWWHAAEARGLGATCARTFPSPWHVAGDMRMPAARVLLRASIEQRHLRRFLPFLLMASAWAAVRNAVRAR